MIIFIVVFVIVIAIIIFLSSMLLTFLCLVFLVLFKVDNKDTETGSVTLVRTLNNVSFIDSSDNLILKLHYYILPLTVISFIL